MKEVPIKSSLCDEEFRKICVDMLSSARHSVYIIAGELGSLVFPDIQMATYEAAKKHGAKVKMYATEYTPITSRNYAVSCGYELYIGKEGLSIHYLLVDEENFVVSLNKKVGEPTVVGKRTGYAHYGDKEGGQKILKEFEHLASLKDTKKITEIDKKSEPLHQLLYSE